MMNGVDFTRSFTQEFCELHRLSCAKARVSLGSAFLSCFSILSPLDRAMLMAVVLKMTETIGEEKFEDGPDFVDFLNEKFKESEQ